MAIALCACTSQSSSLPQSQVHHNDLYDLDQIQQSGEIIVLTLSGPDTYYDYRGKMMGYQFEISELLGAEIGARVRMEVAQNEEELISMLLHGDGDIIAYSIPDSISSHHPDIVSLGDSLSNWTLRRNSTKLVNELDKWFAATGKKRLSVKWHDSEVEQGKKHKSKITPRAPIKNLAAGIISDYDNLFKRYAHSIGWDWRLLAAQAYQESAFDPNATSWAGAQGLIQLMPGTAKDMEVNNPYNPDENVRGAVKYLKLMNANFSDITDQEERIKFMLAAYNCGTLHVKDAQALASKYGYNPQLWTGNVDQFVKGLSEPKYYRDPIVKHGYCRGNEPYNYVIQILDRFRYYRAKVY